MSMFCYQCQEAAKNEGCIIKGVCGKTPEVSHLQDLLIYLLKSISFWAKRARNLGVSVPATDLFVARGLFLTVTNVNFDPDTYVGWISEAVERRDELKRLGQAACNEQHGTLCDDSGLPQLAVWRPASFAVTALEEAGIAFGIMSQPDLNEDIRSLRELIMYGLKGLAAYTEHAYVLDHSNDQLLFFIEEALEATTNDKLGADDLVGLVLKTGEMGVEAMRLLDEANTSLYGNPEPTQVNIGVEPGPAILISGHDLRDLKELLEQTAGKGVNVYTHGEMLPANAYPDFKKYSHFIGNYGGSWWQQREEFESFGGAILMTTNCIVPVKDSYKDRLFTTGLVGWPGCPHIADRVNGGEKDFSPVIASALANAEPQELERGTIPAGFAHATVMSVADQVIEAVKNGDIKRFVVMGGCDGRLRSREYYTDIAQGLPQDHVIMTAGCAKYRYNKLELGEIKGIPRLLDAGQCNDSYSLAYIALQLKDAFGLDDINDLPISYDIAWYEQKAVIVLLALLSLGVKHIRLGPSLPAFLSPGVVKVLVDSFDIKLIGTVAEDLAAIPMGA